MDVPGLTYIPAFITGNTHDELVAAIDANPWGTELTRRVQQYGHSYAYRSREVRYLGPLPLWAAAIAERLLEAGIGDRACGQLIVNEYNPGRGISSHVDSLDFGEPIVSISLLSPCIMEFTHHTKQKIPILLEPRSALILKGPARYEWQHAIPNRKTDEWQGQRLPRQRRLSMTFRTVE
jgi:alkylated DNA repair dioxygenase AlkB